MKSGWVVVVDLAPVAVARRVERTLRDHGFSEVMPWVFITRFGEVDGDKLRAALKRARRGGVGNILACVVAKGEPYRW